MIMQKIFEITEQHLTLLQNAYVWFDDTMYDGAPSIDIKRPYGNKDVLRDIGRILNIPPNVVDRNEDGDSDSYEYDDKLTEQLLTIHQETATALQICLQLQNFETGIYQTYGMFHTKWEKIKHE